MQSKPVVIAVLALVGVYFLIFHTAPLPLNHEAIGLPPFHVAHGIFGIILLGVAIYLWQKSKNTKDQNTS